MRNTCISFEISVSKSLFHRNLYEILYEVDMKFIYLAIAKVRMQQKIQFNCAQSNLIQVGRLSSESFCGRTS